VSGWALAVAAGSAAMLAVTAATQLHGVRWARWLKAHDACAYIPAWTFFAPNPGVWDTRVLWREQLLGGAVGPWHELVPPSRGLRRAVWNPGKRARKGVNDCAAIIVREVARDESSALPMLSLPYLMIVAHMAGRRGSPLGQARQFTVVHTQGEDAGEGFFRVRFVSHWHRQ
jgi:hypothetical protein